MLKTSQVVKTPSVKNLLNLWLKRFTLNISSQVADNSSFLSELLMANSRESREKTAGKLKDHVLDINCQMAWVQTKTLYGYIPNILDLNEARRITHFAFRVYKKLLEIYQKQSLKHDIALIEGRDGRVIPIWDIAEIEELSYELEPTLLVFQEQHIASKDWRALGFMTSQLNFSNKLILKKLTPAEKALLKPYLQFVEEQVAMPWQRVCVAAARHDLDSPMLTLVEQMLPLSEEIAQTVYRRLIQLLPDYRSRRGELTNPEITHSCLRDLNMFQAYLWLCLLEKSMTPIKQELLPLCVMVTEGVEIQWEVTKQWYQVLAEELINHVNPEQKDLLLPYVQRMQQIFFEERARLGCKNEV
ncbi:MAG: hypothetical protein SAK29_31550 [Scytonema sp. PMC 1069.18]|nr:hypothetical protein [Scytonema sp. PMC 1069.18]MEC4881192.1 hypothetical protein [Scytonema sp. PMC 1070.18]